MNRLAFILRAIKQISIRARSGPAHDGFRTACAPRLLDSRPKNNAHGLSGTLIELATLQDEADQAP